MEGADQTLAARLVRTPGAHAQLVPFRRSARRQPEPTWAYAGFLFYCYQNPSYGDLDAIFSGTVDLALIAEQWDELVRIAASLKARTAKAHDVMQRLVGSPADRCSKALTALGEVLKTTYILRYITDPVLRAAVQLQLNRGEARHALARKVFFAELGEFVRGDYEEIMNKASCLSLLSNAVIASNIPAMGSIVDAMRNEGREVRDEDLAHVWPLLRRHITVSGSYSFGFEEPPAAA